MKMMVLIRGRNLWTLAPPIIITHWVGLENFPDDNQKQLSTHKLLFVLNLYPIMTVFCDICDIGGGGRHRAMCTRVHNHTKSVWSRGRLARKKQHRMRLCDASHTPDVVRVSHKI
jgi:hypothetical protein